MVSKKFVIENEQGLHMRPAGVLEKAVTKFESVVQRLNLYVKVLMRKRL